MTFRSGIVLSLAVVQLFVAAAMLAIPYITHRDLLFGVPVPHGFRSTEAGRKALNVFRLWIAIPTTAGLVWMLLLPASPLTVVAFLLTPAAGLAAFIGLNRRLKPFAIQPSLVRETTLEPSQPLPWLVWLGILPLLMLAAAAAYLHAHWDQIPLRYPVHFDINGTPNRWADRSVRGVYGFLIFGGEFALFLFGMMLAGWYGSRRSDSMRRPVLVVLLAAEFIVSLLFALVPLQTAAGFRIPIPLIIVLPLALLIPALAYAAHENNKPRDPVDPTPNECWRGGIIYYNPNDAALFVQRRDGMGFTINFGNRRCWLLYAGLVLVLASGPLVMQSLPK
jgi:uncharacterized membrane protein